MDLPRVGLLHYVVLWEIGETEPEQPNQHSQQYLAL